MLATARIRIVARECCIPAGGDEIRDRLLRRSLRESRAVGRDRDVVRRRGRRVESRALRKRRPQLHRPYRQWLYPVPCVIALLGWVYVYVSASASALLLSGAWIVAGIVVFAIWAKVNRSWPFAPLEIREAYLGSD